MPQLSTPRNPADIADALTALAQSYSASLHLPRCRRIHDLALAGAHAIQQLQAAQPTPQEPTHADEFSNGAAAR